MSFLSDLPYRTLVTAILVVGGLALLPGKAVATCGSYVVLENAHPAPQDRPPQRCDGPECSRAPSTPALPLTAPVSERSSSEQSSIPSETDAEDCFRPGWATFQTAADQPVHLPSAIFHPPRAS